MKSFVIASLPPQPKLPIAISFRKSATITSYKSESFLARQDAELSREKKETVRERGRNV